MILAKYLYVDSEDIQYMFAFEEDYAEIHFHNGKSVVIDAVDDIIYGDNDEGQRQFTLSNISGEISITHEDLIETIAHIRKIMAAEELNDLSSSSFTSKTVA